MVARYLPNVPLYLHLQCYSPLLLAYLDQTMTRLMTAPGRRAAAVAEIAELELLGIEDQVGPDPGLT